jgi:acyl carrier protein
VEYLWRMPMGMDLVEFFRDVKNAFGFSIKDEDVAGLDTVGKLYD